MYDKFDELARQLAQATTRRQALKKFGAGLAGMALACFGLANRAEAAKHCLASGSDCSSNQHLRCCHGLTCTLTPFGLVCQ